MKEQNAHENRVLIFVSIFITSRENNFTIALVVIGNGPLISNLHSWSHPLIQCSVHSFNTVITNCCLHCRVRKGSQGKEEGRLPVADSANRRLGNGKNPNEKKGNGKLQEKRPLGLSR